MGVVWRGRDMLLQRDVAIKEVKIPAAVPASERDAVRARVSREARAAARLSHPNAVTIFDVVDVQGTAYIVMELVDAPTLSDLVRDAGPLQPERAAEIGMDVLSALEAAHREGIVHRDVKPGNVMVGANDADTQGRSKLADFGIASLKGDPKITATGMIMGSPSFMSPEQAVGEVSGPASDMWALGATLYYSVEGRPPFDRGQPIPTLTAVVHDEVEPLNRAGPLEPVVTALLDKNPDRRPDVGETTSMLSAIVAGRAPEPPSPTHKVAPRETRAETPPEARPAPHLRRRADRRGRGWLVPVALLALAALAAALLFAGLTGDDEPRTSAPRNEDRGERPRGGGGGAATGAGFTTFEAPGTGYSVRVPEGWQQSQVAATRYDFRDPESGDYLRVEWTTTPGRDAVAAWEAQEQSFTSSHEDYRRLRLEDIDYQDSPTAALWEYTWTEGGADLHAYNLGFVTGDGEYGFALNMVTDEATWEERQDEWDAIVESFRG